MIAVTMVRGLTAQDLTGLAVTTTARVAIVTAPAVTTTARVAMDPETMAQDLTGLVMTAQDLTVPATMGAMTPVRQAVATQATTRAWVARASKTKAQVSLVARVAHQRAKTAAKAVRLKVAGTATTARAVAKAAHNV